MMTVYVTKDGARYSAVSPEELVSKLHADSFAPAEDDAAWMKEAAVLSQEQSGQPIRSGNAQEFVADLIKAGLLTTE